LVFGVSRSLEGVNPALEGSGGKGDDYPRLFTLNNAKILESGASHDPNQDHIGNGRPRSPDPTQDILAPKGVNKLDGLNLVNPGHGRGHQGS